MQVNVSRGGIPKLPVAEARVSRWGMAGDAHAHPEVHGGPRQALLLIAEEAIEELVAKGYPLYFGALGENLTTRGLDRRAWRSGQRWRIGKDVVIEFTKLREPCKTLRPYGPTIQPALFDKSMTAGDAESPRWALGGFYASVLQEGVIRPGDEIVLDAT